MLLEIINCGLIFKSHVPVLSKDKEHVEFCIYPVCGFGLKGKIVCDKLELQPAVVVKLTPSIHEGDCEQFPFLITLHSYSVFDVKLLSNNFETLLKYW